MNIQAALLLVGMLGCGLTKCSNCLLIDQLIHEDKISTMQVEHQELVILGMIFISE